MQRKCIKTIFHVAFITDTWTKLSASRNGEAQDMTAATSDPQWLTAGLCNFSLVWVSAPWETGCVKQRC